MADTLYHYVIVREDLPIGFALGQAVHAAGESSEGPLPSGTYVVALGVRSEDQLEEYAGRLWEAQVPHKLIVETEGRFADQATAIGIFPTRDRERVRRVTSDLPLYGKGRQ